MSLRGMPSHQKDYIQEVTMTKKGHEFKQHFAIRSVLVLAC